MVTKKTQQEELYEILLNQLKIVTERSTALTDRASGLLGFTGIINTVLVVIIMSVLDQTKVNLLKDLQFFPQLRSAVILGFIFYLISTIFSLQAFRVTKYFPAPRIGSVKFIEAVFNAQSEPVLSKKHLSIQLYDAIQYYNKENINKFNYLLVGALSLTIAIVFTSMIGIILFISIG